MVHLTIFSYYVTFVFHNESTLYSCLSVRNSLLETGAKPEFQVTATGFEPRTAEFVNKHSTI